MCRSVPENNLRKGYLCNIVSHLRIACTTPNALVAVTYVQSRLSPGYNIDWDQVLEVLAEQRSERRAWHEPHASPTTYCFLTRCSIATRASAIGIKHFRDKMSDDDWMGNNDNDFNKEEWRAETQTKLEYYESEYRRLKETTALLELALWKIKIDHGDATGGGGNENMSIDNRSEFRLQCRISCGADYVMENVLPYLLPPDFVRSNTR
jgi:hypothetical protein